MKILKQLLKKEEINGLKQKENICLQEITEKIDELKEGIFWFRQGHIFGTPFYYIDYTLAQVCAFQFWIKSRENREKAWEEYLNLCRLGGSKPFFELMKAANLKNPFTEGTIASVIPKIREFLDSIDDMKM